MSISEHAAWDVYTVNRRLARTINILSDICIAGYPFEAAQIGNIRLDIV